MTITRGRGFTAAAAVCFAGLAAMVAAIDVRSKRRDNRLYTRLSERLASDEYATGYIDGLQRRSPKEQKPNLRSVN